MPTPFTDALLPDQPLGKTRGEETKPANSPTFEEVQAGIIFFQSALKTLKFLNCASKFSSNILDFSEIFTISGNFQNFSDFQKITELQEKIRFQKLQFRILFDRAKMKFAKSRKKTGQILGKKQFLASLENCHPPK